ncbi:hypothetical protein GQ44DRAFT_721410 [Phaeosphaeriaceae sp. PMI808]|nr:hypothetical protein GQ44DRAFT_721410 [Phaeosphaeriaceae sp. PMI808]
MSAGTFCSVEPPNKGMIARKSLGIYFRSQQLGMVVPSTEQVVCFDPQLLHGLETALTISGIIGLRFVTKSVSREVTYTSGDFAANTLDVGVARLFRYLQLIEQHCGNLCCEAVSSNLSPHLGKSYATKEPLNVVGKIWSPEIPKQADFVQLFPAKFMSQIFNLHLNMDYTGPSGRRLSPLQRIVALIGNNPALFVGLKFVYDDGEIKTFCSNRNILDYYYDKVKYVESSFCIDGAAGERISAVEVGCAASLNGIKCIKVCSILIWVTTFFGIDYESSSEYPVDYFSILESPKGTVISGFIATLGTFDELFKNFGIHGQSQDYIKALPLNCTPLSGSQKYCIKRTSPEKAFAVMGTGYTVQTTASLYNVRRI